MLICHLYFFFSEVSQKSLTIFSSNYFGVLLLNFKASACIQRQSGIICVFCLSILIFSLSRHYFLRLYVFKFNEAQLIYYFIQVIFLWWCFEKSSPQFKLISVSPTLPSISFIVFYFIYRSPCGSYPYYIFTLSTCKFSFFIHSMTQICCNFAFNFSMHLE